jgi:glycosyltransferase involved in cell wall biosynthesis
MKVTFVLPGGSAQPAGGPRMVFRYANALSAQGWTVTIVMPPGLRVGPWWRRGARYGRYVYWSLTKAFSPHRWIKMDPRVRLLWVPDLAARRAPEGDAVIATAVQTAEAVAGWPARAGRKFYFIQGYETWDFDSVRVRTSWRLPLQKIAISRWLCDLIETAGESAIHLPNGLDHETFGLDRSPELRDAGSIIFPYHPNPLKGSADALSALTQVKREVPDVRVRAFGTSRPPRRWPVSVDYTRNPSQAALRGLYNTSAIAMAPSHSEGWGLPACEALQCGCALAASDVGGHREFLRQDVNALLHAPRNVELLRANVFRLLREPALRFRLAQQGMNDMAQLRFEPMVERLKQILQAGGSQ